MKSLIILFLLFFNFLFSQFPPPARFTLSLIAKKNLGQMAEQRRKMQKEKITSLQSAKEKYKHYNTILDEQRLSYYQLDYCKMNNKSLDEEQGTILQRLEEELEFQQNVLTEFEGKIKKKLGSKRFRELQKEYLLERLGYNYQKFNDFNKRLLPTHEQLGTMSKDIKVSTIGFMYFQFLSYWNALSYNIHDLKEFNIDKSKLLEDTYTIVNKLQFLDKEVKE